jgi:hypothetical protein
MDMLSLPDFLGLDPVWGPTKSSDLTPRAAQPNRTATWVGRRSAGGPPPVGITTASERTDELGTIIRPSAELSSGIVKRLGRGEGALAFFGKWRGRLALASGGRLARVFSRPRAGRPCHLPRIAMHSTADVRCFIDGSVEAAGCRVYRGGKRLDAASTFGRISGETGMKLTTLTLKWMGVGDGALAMRNRPAAQPGTTIRQVPG